MQDLCIDSRRPKRPIGSTSYEIDKEAANQDAMAEYMSGHAIPPKAPSSRGKHSGHSRAEKKRSNNLAHDEGN